MRIAVPWGNFTRNRSAQSERPKRSVKRARCHRSSSSGQPAGEGSRCGVRPAGPEATVGSSEHGKIAKGSGRPPRPRKAPGLVSSYAFAQVSPVSTEPMKRETTMSQIEEFNGAYDACVCGEICEREFRRILVERLHYGDWGEITLVMSASPRSREGTMVSRAAAGPYAPRQSRKGKQRHLVLWATLGRSGLLRRGTP
jgi:hypothetical protein